MYLNCNWVSEKNLNSYCALASMVTSLLCTYSYTSHGVKTENRFAPFTIFFSYEVLREAVGNPATMKSKLALLTP